MLKAEEASPPIFTEVMGLYLNLQKSRVWQIKVSIVLGYFVISFLFCLKESLNYESFWALGLLKSTPRILCGCYIKPLIGFARFGTRYLSSAKMKVLAF